jgi:hypothetical protein
MNRSLGFMQDVHSTDCGANWQRSTLAAQPTCSAMYRVLAWLARQVSAPFGANISEGDVMKPGTRLNSHLPRRRLLHGTQGAWLFSC